MRAAAVIHLIALPAITAKLTVQIVSQTPGGVKVQGPKETDGNVAYQDASQFGKIGEEPRCLNANYDWVTECPDQLTYVQVGELNFARPTEGRAIHVLTPFETLICSVDLQDKEGEFNHVWSVDQYFLDPDVPLSDPESHGTVEGVQVSCAPGTAGP